MTMNARDPRAAASPEADIRPLVAGRQGPMTVWLAAGGVALGAVLLFNLLDGQRRARTAPTTTLAAAGAGGPAQALPPLYILPETPGPPPPPEPPAIHAPDGPALMAQVPTQPQPPQSLFAPQPPPPNYAPPPWLNEPQPPQSPPQMQAPSSRASALVIDTTSSPRGETSPEDGAPTNGGSVVESGAIQTSRLVRRSSTVAQGTLIPAVLETALDSTRPGFARAIVSNDIRGFDGSRILIPRGSRLYGRYQADIAAGQKRAFVEWTRLVRPDGVSIAIASPAADAQGRAGVEGRVNSHFLQRFGSAVLQTTMAIGVSAASRSISGDPSVIVALPRSSQPATPSLPTPGIQPTLRVDAGTRVSVFVAQDLEFPGGDAR